MKDTYHSILARIDAFIKKHYLYRLLYGAILAVFIMILAFLVVISLEYSGHYSVQIRTILFYSLISAYSLIFVFFILRPFLWFLGLGKQLTRKQAARLIAASFPEMKDTLYNLLELKELEPLSPASGDLIEASILQRTELLKPFTFQAAIDFKAAWKPLGLLGIPAFILLLILLINPGIVTEGSSRIIQYNTYFEKPAPFSFQLLTDNLSIRKGEDLTLDLEIRGEKFPENVKIHFAGSSMYMMKISNTLYAYTFRNINNDFVFSFEALGIQSQEYRVKVIPLPIIFDFYLDVDVPAYTRMEDFTLENTGNLTIPAGSKIKWLIKTAFVDSLQLRLAYDTLTLRQDNKDKFSLQTIAMESSEYALLARNTSSEWGELLKYSMTVIPDLYPGIQLESKIDSLLPFLHYFKGTISDDYGFQNLKMIILLDNQVDSSITLPFTPGILNQDFFAAFDFSVYHQDEQITINYYFEVSDNDGVNGSKSTRSEEFSYTSLSKAELDSFSKDATNELDELLRESKKMSDDLLKDLNSLKEKSVNEVLTEWEQSQKLEKMISQEKQLQQMLDQIKEANELKNQLENTYDPASEELLKKQEELENLMESLFDEELKDLMKQLQELQKDFDPKQMQKLAEEMQLSMEDLKDELDRNIELLKKYEIEKDMDKAVEQLEKLSQEQQKLAEDIAKEGLNQEKLEKESQQQQEFDALKKEYEENMKKNEELKNPMPLQNMAPQLQEISKNFQKDQQSMQSGNKKESSKGAAKNSKELKEASQSLSAMMQQMRQQQQDENIDNLKQIVNNLITFSFEQEALSLSAQKVLANDAAVNKIILEQTKLKNDFAIIEDSLKTFSMREPRAGALIDKELNELNRKFVSLTAHEEFPNMQVYSREQQFVMTNVNNLALLLSELIKQMEQEMNSMGQPKEGENCDKPSNKSKPGMKGLKEMQEGLKSQLQKMLEQMKQGQGPEGKQMSKESMNKQLAQMLAQQEIFRDMLNKLMNDKGISTETQKILQEINRMSDDMERELVNKRITPELLNRQQKILTRLLEAEKSENKREFEEKRESKENSKQDVSKPDSYFNQQKNQKELQEIIEYQDVKLKNYYELRFQEYIRSKSKPTPVFN